MTRTTALLPATAARLRRLILVAATGAALVSGAVGGVSAHSGASRATADPCPCTLPQCRPLCAQN
jgi:hypothetical protein